MTSARLVLPPDRRIMRYNGRRSYCLLLVALRHVTSFMPRCTSGQSAIQLSRGWGLAAAGGGGGGTVEVCTKIHSTCFFCFFYHHQLRRSCCHRYAPALSRDRASVLRMAWIRMESRSMSFFCFVLFWDVFPLIISVQPSEIVSENLWKNSAFTSSLRIINVGFGLFSLRLKPPPSHHCVHLRTKYTPQLSSGSCARRRERPAAAADQGFRQSHDFIEVVFWWGSLHKGTLNF